MVRLNEALGLVAEADLMAEWLSVGASAGLLNEEAGKIAALAGRRGMKAMIRPGLALYGVAPQFEPDEPQAVAAARARLIIHGVVRNAG